jgi:RimJ/RimL family protein N-acetyltransferase
MPALYPLPAAPRGLGARQISPLDRDGLVDMFERLSPESRRRRFLSPKVQLTERELIHLTDVDHVRHEALVAIGPDDEIIGVARYVCRSDDPDIAEISVVVADDWQRRGIGGSLVRLLIMRARTNLMARLTATTLWENCPARGLLAGMGFRASGSSGELIEFALPLRDADPARPSPPRLARR